MSLFSCPDKNLAGSRRILVMVVKKIATIPAKLNDLLFSLAHGRLPASNSVLSLKSHNNCLALWLTDLLAD